MNEIEIDGVKVKTQVLGDSIWFHWKGETYVVPTLASQRAKQKRVKSPTGVASGLILAPMPGKITQLPLKVGDQVMTGQIVLVMEAMKMEYTLKSQTTGTLRSISCVVGQQVPADFQLAEIAVLGAPLPKKSKE